MGDEELGRELAPDETPENQLRLVAALSPERRAAYEHLVFVGNELNAGRIPPGVMT